MKLPKLFRKGIISILLILFNQIAIGQIQITGTVYDRTQQYPLPGVSVVSTSGTGTITDSLGHYTMKFRTGDSVYFSYLNKPTAKFPVKDISADEPFDISLEVAVESLPTVLVNPGVYRRDSLQNRIEYQKVFNYGKGYIDNVKANRGRSMGVGLDMDMLFDGKSNRRMLAFQKRLEQEEKDNYIDHRFTKAIVKKITGLEPPMLDSFMIQYRPSYEFIQSCGTEYEYYKYISECGKFFKESLKEEHPANKKN
jgi:carboxypeptidase-like protein